MPLTTTPCFPEAGRKEFGYEQKAAYSEAEAVGGGEMKLQAYAASHFPSPRRAR